MTLVRIPIIAWDTVPDGSGDIFIEPATIKATNDFFRQAELIFNDSGDDDEIFGSFDVPQNYVDSAGLRIIWTTTAIVGDWEAGLAYRAVGGTDTESLDQATAQESLLSGNNFTAPSAINERMSSLISMTDANLEPGDTVLWIVSREGLDAGDTLAAAIRARLYFEFDDGN